MLRQRPPNKYSNAGHWLSGAHSYQCWFTINNNIVLLFLFLRNIGTGKYWRIHNHILRFCYIITYKYYKRPSAYAYLNRYSLLKMDSVCQRASLDSLLLNYSLDCAQINSLPDTFASWPLISRKLILSEKLESWPLDKKK